MASTSRLALTLLLALLHHVIGISAIANPLLWAFATSSVSNVNPSQMTVRASRSLAPKRLASAL